MSRNSSRIHTPTILALFSVAIVAMAIVAGYVAILIHALQFN